MGRTVAFGYDLDLGLILTRPEDEVRLVLVCDCNWAVTSRGHKPKSRFPARRVLTTTPGSLWLFRWLRGPIIRGECHVEFSS